MTERFRTDAYHQDFPVATRHIVHYEEMVPEGADPKRAEVYGVIGYAIGLPGDYDVIGSVRSGGPRGRCLPETIYRAEFYRRLGGEIEPLDQGEGPIAIQIVVRDPHHNDEAAFFGQTMSALQSLIDRRDGKVAAATGPVVPEGTEEHYAERVPVPA